MSYTLSVLVQTPAHSALAGALSYESELALAPGTLVRVPLGKRDLLGVVWQDADLTGHEPEAMALRPISGVLEGMAPLNRQWRELVNFAARYYQRSCGEVALSALPPQLRDLTLAQVARKLQSKSRPLAATKEPLVAPPGAPLEQGSEPIGTDAGVTPSDEQTLVLSELATQSGPFLLYGATGSGKTEVYLRSVQQLLAQDPNAQALVMVPEINLTPQLLARFTQRFGTQHGPAGVVCMHSGMTPAQRLNGWLMAHTGAARIVLGTRMAIFASMPHLKLIVVDEEHDPSYKQQEGSRYSARDLAVYRGRLEGARVILGSATPSLESWHLSRPGAQGGRYQRLLMPSRIGEGQLPWVRRVDMNHQPKGAVISAPLLEAIKTRIARGEQSMVFLNRRGYAPVLQCHSCDWKSECPHCSAFRVFHKIDRTLRCHHCGLTDRVPRACPACGDLDIAPIGRGTEQLEEHLAQLLAEVRRPATALAQAGTAVRIARIDADSNRKKGHLQTQLAQVHAGEVDVLVGTQMIAKGHDFRRITLVAAINPDGVLFSSDFRAPERLFSLLMQAGGRAGRERDFSERSEMWVQTFYPQHPLFVALKSHDYPAFAQQQLKQREQANLPPFSSQALVRAEARSQQAAQDFLMAARASAAQLADLPGFDRITLYPAVPMSMQRIANVERAQMLIESPSRTALQRFLSAWHTLLQATRALPEHKGLIRWAVDVDPLAI
jgi:primosomal protein N' (replication factor Y) (superfamily II helicase)